MKRIVTVSKLIPNTKHTPSSVLTTPLRSNHETLTPKKEPAATVPTKTVTSKPKATLPNAHFFGKLKKTENRQFSQKHRDRSDYKDNYSAALSLPCSNHELASKHFDHNALLLLSQEHIIEHANRALSPLRGQL
ncbi:MAG: hypothetical protein ACRCXC_06210 [Legionella sp.]